MAGQARRPHTGVDTAFAPPVMKPPYNGNIDRLEQDLLGEASRRCGLIDYGDDGFRKGMRVFLEAFGPLSDASWQATRDELLRGLICRLRTEEGWKRNPGYRDVAIPRPLVICGVPRTGTTALHRLLSVDPQFQGLEHWLCEYPMPRPHREAWPSHPAYCEAHRNLTARHAASPGMKIAHEVVVDELDECLEVLRQDFVSNRFACTFHVPAYDRWFREQDEGPSYRRLADVMRLIGLRSDKRWLLKNPGHFAQLHQLFAVFPDACVVVTSRDIVRAMASLASVLAASQGRFDDRLDPSWIGPREVEYWGDAARQADGIMAQRPNQFHAIKHDDFHRDPLGVVRGVYAHFGLLLTGQTEDRMQRWLASNPAGKNGPHRYALEPFGLTEELILNAFGGASPEGATC